MRSLDVATVEKFGGGSVSRPWQKSQAKNKRHLDQKQKIQKQARLQHSTLHVNLLGMHSSKQQCFGRKAQFIPRCHEKLKGTKRNAYVIYAKQTQNKMFAFIRNNRLAQPKQMIGELYYRNANAYKSTNRAPFSSVNNTDLKIKDLRSARKSVLMLLSSLKSSRKRCSLHKSGFSHRSLEALLPVWAKVKSRLLRSIEETCCLLRYRTR